VNPLSQQNVLAGTLMVRYQPLRVKVLPNREQRQAPRQKAMP
jgi:hypothetical protein